VNHSNSHLTVREVAEEVGISKTTCHGIFMEKFGHALCCSQICAVPAEERPKKTCVDVSKECIVCANADEIFIKNTVTDDETWVCSYVVETKAQYSHWVSKMSPRPKQTWQVWSNVKVMLTVLFDCEGIIYHEVLPLSQMAKREYDEKAERGNEEKEVCFVKGEKMVVP